MPYNAAQINGLISVLAFRPRKAVFICDRRRSLEDLLLLEKACTHTLKNLIFEFVTVEHTSLDSIQMACKKVIRENPNCVFDIAGGEELTVIGMYLACLHSFTPVFKLDLDSIRLVNVYGCDSLALDFELPHLDLETLLISRGALMEESLHPTPRQDQFGPILFFCEKVFKNIDLWKSLCVYIQNGVKKTAFLHKNLSFGCKTIDNNLNTKDFNDLVSLLEHAQASKLIHRLNISDNRVSFVFSSHNIKKYMTDFGSWLELYTYITLFKSGLFKDLKMSVKIAWGGALKNEHSDVVNEVDITFFSGITPVFISCKLSCPNSEAIQELSIYSNYFGGKKSKCILVTVADVYTENPRIFHRAKEMGIYIVDSKYIKTGRLIDGIKKALSDSPDIYFK